MKRNGFTLVELLGVITLLAIILLITVPNITRTLQRNSENEYKHFVEELELATETYLQNNRSSYPQLSEAGGVVLVRMEELIDYGVIDSNLINPETKEKIKKSDLIVVRKNEDKVLEYTFLAASREIGEVTFVGVEDVIRIQEGELYDFLKNVTAVESGNNNVITNITASIEDSTTLTVGMYNLVYEVKIGGKTFSQNAKVIVEKTYTFDLINASKEFPIQVDGDYLIELWGAKGGNGYSTYIRSNYSYGGLGAYTKGNISLKKGTILYVTVGGAGTNSTTNKNNIGTVAGGYNGGGYGRSWNNGNSYVHNGAGGGGATHIALQDGLLSTLSAKQNQVLMVAAGGGGGGGHEGSDNGGIAGGLTGGNGYQSSWELNAGGTQTSGGLAGTACQYSPGSNGAFGTGGNCSNSGGGGGGGAGYYGGGGGQWNAGGGGSSYINGYTGCTTKNTDYVFKNTVMKAGNEEMPTYDGTSTMTGNSGNGYAKIKYIGE